MPASRPRTEWTDAWQDWPPPARLAAAPAREERRPRPERQRPEREPRRPPRTSPPRTSREGRPSARTSSRPARAPGVQRPPSISGERARRMRHLRALRRDLLVDFVAAFVLMLMVLIATAGLGVVLLLEIPLAALVLGSFVLERRLRRRR